MTIISIEELDKIDPNDREHIVVLSQEDIDQAMQSYESGKFLLDQRVCYLVKPSANEVKNSRVMNNQMANLKAGSLLLLSENGTGYEPYELMMRNSINRQLHSFIELCQFMGVKSVKLKSVSTNNKSASTRSNASVGVGFEAKAGYSGDIVSKIVSEFESHTHFLGNNNPNIVAAENLINTGVFKANDTVLNFYKLAKERDNRTKSHTVKMKLAAEVAKKMKVFANLQIPVLQRKFGADWEKIQNASTEHELAYEIYF